MALPERPSDFRSDTVTRPTPAMRAAMRDAEVGDDVFGDDPTVHALEALAAEILGKPAALFVPSGTMGNQIAVRLHTRPGDEMICEAGSHTYNYEVGGAAALWGVQTRPIHRETGRLTEADVLSAIQPDDVHLARTRLLVLENTHTHAGGRVLPLAFVHALGLVAHQRGLAVHLDGARLWNACAATGASPAAYAAGADTVMCCLSKGLGAPVGSVLAGTAAAIAEARRVRKMLGGGMRQAGILAAAGLVALRTMRDRLPEDHARARRLATALAAIPGGRVDLPAVESNIVHLGVPTGSGDAVVRALAARGVWTITMDPSTVRFVTHLDIGDADCDRAIAAMPAAMAEAGRTA